MQHQILVNEELFERGQDAIRVLQRLKDNGVVTPQDVRRVSPGTSLGGGSHSTAPLNPDDEPDDRDPDWYETEAARGS